MRWKSANHDDGELCGIGFWHFFHHESWRHTELALDWKRIRDISYLTQEPKQN
jgi:hypothetical protein